MIVKVRRRGDPRSPTNTGPQLTPIRTSKSAVSSTMVRTVRSIRSSSSSDAVGAPAARMIFPPSATMSVAIQWTPLSRAAPATIEASRCK
jgi:hypothetical protein